MLRLFNGVVGGGLGVLCVYVAMVVSAEPDPSDIRWLPSSAVASVSHEVSDNGISRIRLFDATGYCVTVSQTRPGFDELDKAITGSLPYSIGYTLDKALFSSDDVLYQSIDQIVVDGRVLRAEPMRARSGFWVLLAIGVFMIGFGSYCAFGADHWYDDLERQLTKTENDPA